MTRLWTDGAESGDALFWDAGNAGASNVGQRSGNYCYQLGGVESRKTIPDLAEFYVRFGWRAVGTAAGDIFIWRNTAGTKMGSLRFDGLNYVINIGNNSTTVASGNVLQAINTYYLIELHIKIADSPDGIVQVRVEGILDIDYSGEDTKPTADATVSHVTFNNLQTGDRVDDLAFNDINGVVDNSWCNDGHIVCLTPNAAGDLTQWIPFPSTGTNYDMVNDIPADGDATYIYQTGTNACDLYNLTTTTLPVTIYRVWSEARAKDTVAEGGEISLLIKTNGVIYTGTSVPLLTSFTKQVLGSVYTTNPQTGLAWSLSELDALQVGVMLRS